MAPFHAGWQEPSLQVLLITGMLLLPGCLVSADQQRDAIRAGAISAGQLVWKMVRQPWEQGSREGRRNRELRAWAALSRHRLVQQ